MGVKPVTQIKRVYDPPEKADGFRALVDRLWPRGLKKENAHIDAWLKEAAPSAELRKWFNHVPERWEAFARKYREELKEENKTKELIILAQKHKKITLLYGARDETHNQAVVLMQFLKSAL
ncbi:MAG TPA: DUF488 family protein [Flavitalea sp.]|nr:DUF488 family protein [Flavitalea sp.]